jgi:AAA15 family ATPase/GTPase
MKIELINIGLIGHSKVEIDGITVMAGENATGKSTVGKALYSMFNAFHDIHDKVKMIRYQNVNHILFQHSRPTRQSYDKLVTHIINNRTEFINNTESLLDYVKENAATLFPEKKDNLIRDQLFEDSLYYSSEGIDGVIQVITDEILESLSISTDSIINRIIQRSLDVEFNEEIGNKYKTTEENSSLRLIIKEEELEVKILKVVSKI